MHTTSATYIAAEVFAALVVGIILFCLLINNPGRNAFSRRLTQILILNMAAVLVDAASVIAEGNPDAFSRAAGWVANLLLYIITFFMIAAYTIYLIAYLRRKGPVPKWVMNVAVMVCLLTVLLVVLLQAEDRLFFIDTRGYYHRGAWFGVFQTMGTVCLLYETAVVLIFRKYLNRRETLTFLAYCLIPLMAVALQVSIPGFPFLHVSMTLASLILYTGIQADERRRLIQTENELAVNRVDVMLSQIQPHFLYNALTAIAMLCGDNPQKAKRAIVEFSHYLRGNMDSLTQQHLIPFEKELEHTKVYIGLEQMRFGGDLNVVFDIGPRVFRLPALTVQPIVENAVKYGVGQKEGGGTVWIRTRETPQAYLITVEDDGVGYDLSKPQYDGRTHIGIDNVRRRLEAQCLGSLEIHSVKGEGTTATIHIPREMEEEI